MNEQQKVPAGTEDTIEKIVELPIDSKAVSESITRMLIIANHYIENFTGKSLIVSLGEEQDLAEFMRTEYETPEQRHARLKEREEVKYDLANHILVYCMAHQITLQELDEIINPIQEKYRRSGILLETLLPGHLKEHKVDDYPR